MRVALLLPLVLLVLGCGKAASSGDVAFDAKAPVMAGEATAAAPEARLATNETPAMPRLVERNAELTLRVKSLPETERRIGRMAEGVGGLVEASAGTDLAGPNPDLSITLRVPESRFDAALESLEALGTRLGKTIATDDVTAQAVDLDARLKSLRVQEDAYRAILGNARKIADVLEVQERLTGVRTSIEEIVAQRRTLGDGAARSKIVVSLTQAALPNAPAPEPDWIAQTWGDATATLRAVGRAFASLSLWLVAMIPVWLPLGLVAAWAWRRRHSVAA